MPPLVCPSPNVVDQTFPRSNEELRLVQRALARLVLTAEEEECVILLTGALSDFIINLDQTFCWEVISRYPEVHIIYRVLAQLGLQQHGVRRVNVSAIKLVDKHPLPAGIEPNEFSTKWADELGRLYILHANGCSPGNFFIGVACTLAFAGENLGNYDNPTGLPALPLVGPNEVHHLDDEFEWDIPAGIHDRKVSFGDAYHHIRLLGGEVHTPTGSSHYQVRFKGARIWPLDVNLDPIPDPFLKQLEPITGQDIDVIKYVLLNGRFPKRVSRLPQ
jgi:hypothetical protein